MRLPLRSLSLFEILACITGAIASEPAPLAFVADVPLFGRAVRFDYQASMWQIQLGQSPATGRAAPAQFAR